MRYQTLTHELFEHLFNKGFVGSRWMDQSEVEEFYKEYKILNNDDSVTLYAREIIEGTNRQTENSEDEADDDPF